MSTLHVPDRRQFVGTLVAVAAGGLPSLGRPENADAEAALHDTELVTVPITAASFPPEVLPAEGGRIEFWAKLHDGFTGGISVGGFDPHFFQLVDPHPNFHSTYQMGFNSDDGEYDGGLVGVVGYAFQCGTGHAGSWTYEKVYGAGNVTQWHYYSFRWNQNKAGDRKLFIYIDGVLNASSWHSIPDRIFPPVVQGTFNLITTAGPAAQFRGPVLMHGLRIWDGSHNLILSNTLETQEDLEHSIVGANGSFNGFGEARFVPDAHHGHGALRAFPVGGLASS
jgi:hypothetical protein